MRASGRSTLLTTRMTGRRRLERLAQHEARLRQRPLARVDEQQHAVDHRQPALDLAAEVGVAGRVDDVDLHAAVADRRVLGEDRDALLALEVHRVHDALGDVLVLAERAGLPQHARRPAWSCRGRRGRRSRRCGGRCGEPWAATVAAVSARSPASRPSRALCAHDDPLSLSARSASAARQQRSPPPRPTCAGAAHCRMGPSRASRLRRLACRASGKRSACARAPQARLRQRSGRSGIN